ncbi:MAG: putative OB-fold protein, partial [Bermanella sp.]
TAESLTEYVDLPDTGVIKSWAWVKHPRGKHPLSKPFAWAQIQFDGADIPMIHCVDAGDEAAMKTGMRVKVRWADETKGSIHDIACFEPA